MYYNWTKDVQSLIYTIRMSNLHSAFSVLSANVLSEGDSGWRRNFIICFWCSLKGGKCFQPFQPCNTMRKYIVYWLYMFSVLVIYRQCTKYSYSICRIWLLYICCSYFIRGLSLISSGLNFIHHRAEFNSPPRWEWVSHKLISYQWANQ